jgi:mRNA interferase MazF
VPLRSNLRLADAPGNVILPARASGLPRESVANVSQLIAVDRGLLSERVGHLSADLLLTIFAGVDLVLGREQPSVKRG